MTTFADYQIDVPAHAAGNVRTICPQCSNTRKKSRDKSLSVNVNDGVFFCHHCGWKGTTKQRKPYAATPAPIYSQNVIDGALKILKARERGEPVDDHLMMKAKGILKTIPEYAAKLSHRAQTELDDMLLKRTADRCRKYVPAMAVCTECGKQFDLNASFPKSEICLPCHADRFGGAV